MFLTSYRFILPPFFQRFIKVNNNFHYYKRTTQDLKSQKIISTKQHHESRNIDALFSKIIFVRGYETQIEPSCQTKEKNEIDLDQTLQKLRNRMIHGEKITENEFETLIIECGRQGKIQEAEQVNCFSYAIF